MVAVAVLGYGTVGSGVVKVMEKNHDSILAKTGVDIQVKYVLDLREFPGDPVQGKLVHDYDVIINDPEVRIVVETMGGLNPAYPFTKRALEAGKSACTSNKELVARHGTELLEIAREHQVSYLFEASCGGGIPIIRPMRTSLCSDELDEITGIVNGTTNYVLTKMMDEGSEFDDVLHEAQEKGYAERNPEADVEGHDACRKLAILSSLAYGKRVDYSDIYTEGISKITSAEIRYAKELGMAIRLLAHSRKEGENVLAMVAPFLVQKNDPLYLVNGVFNAIFVHGTMLGDAMFYGQGAGKEATASAVVADVIEEAQTLGRSVMSEWSPEKQDLQPLAETRKQFFVRVKGDINQREDVENVFGAVSVVDADLSDEYGFITPVMSEADYQECAAKLEGQILGMIRIRG
ncbi:MAG: homoserine dehydrogenase [Lachnospiraceae bacterium]|nr:homoserine dehydrogenase [Lachnospiraceae bacterium]